MVDGFKLIYNGNFDQVYDQIDSLDLTQLDEEGANMLHVAVARNAPDLAEALIQKGVPINQADANGQTPLHFAAEIYDLKSAASMLSHGGNPNVQDKYGNSPLWKATFNARGNYEMVKLLMAHDADPGIKNNAGRSSLDFAIQIGDDELVEILNIGIGE